MATNEKDALKEALLAAAETAAKDGEKKSKEEYLKDFKETRNMMGRKKKFKDIKNGSKVFTEDVKTKYELERRLRTEISKAKQELVHVYQKKENLNKGKKVDGDCFLTGVVRIISPVDDYGMCAIVNYGTQDDMVQVIIPFDKFTDLTDEEIQQNYRISKNTFIRRRLDTTIDFCVEDYIPATDESPEYFVGNRIEAMQEKKYGHWYGEKIDGNSSYYLFDVGDIIEARIVGVFSRNILVEVLGIEVLIPQRELSWFRFERVEDLSYIKHGGLVDVKITELKRMEDSSDVKISVSVKEARENPMESALLKYKPGASASGVVTYIRFSEENIRKSTCTVRLADAEVFCSYPPMGVRTGQRVNVEIGHTRGRNEKTNAPFLHARITHVYKDDSDLINTAF